MTFEERVLAAKAKLDEACDELLELVTENLGAAADIAQILSPKTKDLGPSKVDRVYRDVAHDDEGNAYAVEIPLRYAYCVDRRSVKTDPEHGVGLCKGSVFMVVGLEPEDAEASKELQEIARGFGSEDPA